MPQRLHVNQITTKEASPFPTPTMLVGLESKDNFHEALLDSRLDSNVMPKSIYDKVYNKKLQGNDATLHSF